MVRSSSWAGFGSCLGFGVFALVAACESSDNTNAAGGTTNADPTQTTDQGLTTAMTDADSDTTTDNDTATTDSSTETGSDTDELPDGVTAIELRADNFTPPGLETYYSCHSFTFTVDQLHHIVGFRPAVTNPIIHHYVLSLADGNITTDPIVPCVEWPANILWAWAPGIETTMLPDEAGFLLGDVEGGQHTFILQVHYNDPAGVGIVDDNGLDVLVTTDLRPNAAGIFSQGDVGGISIPAGQTAYEHVSECSGASTQSLLTNPIHVFSSFLHAHEIGAAISASVERADDGSIDIVAVDDPFDFDAQSFVDADIDIMPGDTMRTACIYDSSNRTETTSGGPASNEEMCINFMMYYPKVDGQKCGSI